MDRLTEIFSEILEVPAGELSDDSSPETVETWDSLAAMSLVSTIEMAFGIELTTSEMMKMNTIGIAREVLLSKGVDLD